MLEKIGVFLFGDHPVAFRKIYPDVTALRNGLFRTVFAFQPRCAAGKLHRNRARAAKDKIG